MVHFRAFFSHSDFLWQKSLTIYTIHYLGTFWMENRGYNAQLNSIGIHASFNIKIHSEVVVLQSGGSYIGSIQTYVIKK